MRTLLTGFGPFGAIAYNPSARIVEQFARMGAAGHELTCRVLPVSYARAEAEIRGLLSAGEFDAAVLLGVARRDAGFRLERFAHRRNAQRADVDGAIAGSLEPTAGRSEIYSATVSTDSVCETLISAGFPAYVSEDAGGYVCNHTYYAALDCLAAADPTTHCLFIHVPPDAETFHEPWHGPTMPLERQIAGVALVLEWLAASRQPR